MLSMNMISVLNVNEGRALSRTGRCVKHNILRSWDSNQYKKKQNKKKHACVDYIPYDL